MSDTKYADITRNTDEFIKRVAHRRRHTQALSIANPESSDTILDYGCADGYFLSLISNVPRDRMVAYDPDPGMLAQMDNDLAASVKVFNDRDRLLAEHEGEFSLIVCMEVCEHLSSAALDVCLKAIKRLAAGNARVVFGVPIETGVSGFAKGLYRWTKKNRMGATIGSSFRVLLSLPIGREFDGRGWHGSHIGFNDRKFRTQLEQYGFKVEGTSYIPFQSLKRVINNEVYYVCRL